MNKNWPTKKFQKIENTNIIHGNSLEVLKSFEKESIDCVVTSPPYYGLRDYGVEGQIGREDSLDLYIKNLVFLFVQIRRVLKKSGTVWLNLGDTYCTGDCECFKLKPKDLMGVPWRVALALQNDGWYLRSDIIWHKPNGLPASAKDRPSPTHEYVFLLTKNKDYFYDEDATKQTSKDKKRYRYEFGKAGKAKCKQGSYVIGDRDLPSLGANIKTVWTISNPGFKGAHFATFPQKLVENCILSGSPRGGVVLDPFCGSGTTGLVSLLHGRKFIGIELNLEYVEIARKRILGNLI